MIQKFFIICLWLLLISNLAFPQTPLQEQTRLILNDNQKGETYLREYLQPITISFGTVMGGALFHRAYVKSLPGFDLGISFSHVFIPDKAKYFQWAGETVPTFFGPQHEDEGSPDGYNIKTLSVPQIQLNLGLFANFEILVRGISSYKVNEIGNIDIYGVGFKYGLSDLISSSYYIIDLSVQATYHIMRFDRWLDAGSFAMNIQFSKDFNSLPLGLYAGLGYEATSVTINSQKLGGINGNVAEEIKLTDQNFLRFLIGTSVTFYFMTFNIDYNICEYHSVAGGIKIVF